jgi:hypothetical protein
MVELEGIGGLLTIKLKELSKSLARFERCDKERTPYASE